MFVDEKKIDSRFLNALLRLENYENESLSNDIHSFVENFDILQEIELAELDELNELGQFVSGCYDDAPASMELKSSLIIAITKGSADDSTKKRKIDRVVFGVRNCFSA